MSDPIWLPDVLRAEGLTVREVAGWRDRGHGDFGGIWGVVCHHTGSNNASANSIAFHPDLGLASQLHLSRDGIYTICGVGIAWHAGQGSWPGIQTNNANQVTIGIEAANAGRDWPAAQYNAYVRGVAAILRKLGQPASHAIGHKEWGAIQGKWDPGAIDMNAFRRDVAAAMDRRPPVVVVNEINECAKRTPWLGKRLQPNETPVGKDGKGRMVPFEHGHVYFYPGLGAHAIPHGGLFEAFAEYGYERGFLGYPVRDFTKRDHGAVQAFQGGVLYRQDGAAHGYFVTGDIGKRYADTKYEGGPWGYPTSLEFVDKDGNRVQTFEHTVARWHSSHVVATTA